MGMVKTRKKYNRYENVHSSFMFNHS